jgi:hypothetical protein
MNSKNTESYQTLYSAYTRQTTWPLKPRELKSKEQPSPSPMNVAKIIDDVLHELPGAKLRADAKYFLLVNMHQMVVLPLAMSGNNESHEVHEAVRSDVKTIIRKIPKSKSREISGHEVLDAVAKTWSKLQVNQLDFWE